MQVGILGIQGDFEKHQTILRTLGAEGKIVRYAHELDSISGLIIPGGESTAITHIIRRMNLIHPLKQFALSKSVFGTCAGLIMMARNGSDTRVESLEILDVTVKRNAYGRQVFSFSEELELTDPNNARKVIGTFIRAPKIERVGPQVNILASLNDEPVAIQGGFHIGISFHPELDGESYFHEKFLSQCELALKGQEKSNVA